MRFDAHQLAVLVALGAVTATVGCGDGEQRTPRIAAGIIDDVDNPDDLPADPDGDGPAGDCDRSGPVPTLQALEDRFVADVYPLMTRTEPGGCIACHDGVSGRAMVLSPADNGGDINTFLRLRGTGFFTFHQGSAVNRILDESMPLGGPAWTTTEKATIERFGCDLRRIDGENPIPLDEQFPAELDRPYTGAVVDDYDNAFLNYAQLRGRIDVVFDDAWVRDGVDRFSENIALFGGVDFISTFVPARQATAEFLAGFDLLAEDVCERAAKDGTGPFAGIDLDAALIDEPATTTTLFEAERQSIVGLPEVCLPNANATRVNLCTNASITTEYTAPAQGDYRVSAVVIPFPNTSGVRQPIMEIRIDGRAVASITVPGSGTPTTVSAVVPITRSGVVDVAVAFVNDSGEGGDRNLAVDNFSVQGPIAGSTPGVENGTRDTRAQIATVASRILQRPFVDDADDNVDETAALYDVLLAMDAFQPEARDLAWAGVCEAVMQHPDFLFTRAPSFDTATDAGLKDRFLATQAALVLIDRTPTASELTQLDVGEVTRSDLIETWLDSDEHNTSYLNRVREILEFDGTPDGEEPARLWAYLEKNDRPLKEVLTADYTVDVDGNRSDRPAFHGQTGVLTMKGYIVGKPGLPAYNYAARVMTGFMGRVFEVPQAALDARATATAISTVDPTSLCFSCHNVLTPLAHQRLKWDNAGNHRETFDDGRAIDDSDNNLVAGYPYKGVGLEAFTLVAVKKEAFARRMANAHFLMVFGRLLRLEGDTADEGAVYRRLFDAIDAGNGTFKDIERLILTSSSVTTPRIAPAVEPMTGLLGLAGGEQ